MEQQVLELTLVFYRTHTEIQASHGIEHVRAVHQHACHATDSHDPPLSAVTIMEIHVASLLHDVDDPKYFYQQQKQQHGGNNYDNARQILQAARMPLDSLDRIVDMIRWVGCSQNGNRVPDIVQASDQYHLLIPRWADRLEAVGATGVVRCYQYNTEHGKPLSSATSPRATTVAEVWQLATAERFAAYSGAGSTTTTTGGGGGGTSDDMISHYYDKLLHVACPPPGAVRNAYLQRAATASAQPLLHMCLRFGVTGKVDVEYVKEIANSLSIEL
jgi:uncharacterized protein